jgi:hypothetical protein
MLGNFTIGNSTLGDLGRGSILVYITRTIKYNINNFLTKTRTLL